MNVKDITVYRRAERKGDSLFSDIYNTAANFECRGVLQHDFNAALFAKQIFICPGLVFGIPFICTLPNIIDIAGGERCIAPVILL